MTDPAAAHGAGSVFSGTYTIGSSGSAVEGNVVCTVSGEADFVGNAVALTASVSEECDVTIGEGSFLVLFYFQ